MNNAATFAIIATMAVGTAIALRAADERPRPPELDQTFAPGQPAPVPRQWQGRRESTCPLPADATARPAICVAAPARPAYARGEAMTTRIDWRGVPAGSSIVVYLVRDRSDGTQGTIRYLGATGPLTLNAIPISGDGSMAFAWNGHEFACAPADAPMLCQDTANIGRYRIGAIVYAREQVAIVGWPDPHPPALLALSTSPPFVVRGTPELGEIKRSLWWAAMDQAMARHEIASSSILGDTDGRALQLYQRGNRLCAAIPATPPYRSTLEACVAKARIVGDAGLLPAQKADIAVTGEVTVATGALSRDRAVALAQDAADRPYIPRVAFRHQPTMEQAGYTPGSGGGGSDDRQAWDDAHPAATTYLSNGARDAVYRPDLGGGWVVVVDEIMAGGRLPDGQRFADKVLVFVTAGGKACAIETRRYKGDDFSRDPATAGFSCP